MHVCHTCDNRACCNPSHLFVGTAADNNADRARKGRSAPRHKIWAVQHPPKGERNGRAKLTEGDVREARALHKSGMTTQEIAKQFSVSNGTIWFIVSGVNWTHVE
jgi:DNA invertase Pin-like site-specific DNA recombinase